MTLLTVMMNVDGGSAACVPGDVDVARFDTARKEPPGRFHNHGGDLLLVESAYLPFLHFR